MRMRTHGRQTMVTETSKTKHVSILNSNPIQQYNVFLPAGFFQAG